LYFKDLAREDSQNVRRIREVGLAVLPDVPTAQEAGLNYQMSIWSGMFAPKRTAPHIVAKLAWALDQALDDPGVQNHLPTWAPRSRKRTNARRRNSKLTSKPKSPAGCQS
jgi:hypothetical protein